MNKTKSKRVLKDKQFIKDDRTNMRIPKSLKDQLIELARLDRRSYNDIAIMAIEFGLEGVKSMVNAKLKSKKEWAKVNGAPFGHIENS